ncbi:MAG: hypothetical protein ACRC35_08155 [Angustibacter sp.]
MAISLLCPIAVPASSELYVTAEQPTAARLALISPMRSLAIAALDDPAVRAGAGFLVEDDPPLEDDPPADDPPPDEDPPPEDDPPPAEPL